MKKSRIALALAAVMACGTFTACSPLEMLMGMSLVVMPASVGYVEKSKAQSADANAKTIMTCVNMALAEMDEEGIAITLNGWYDKNDENVSTDKQWQDLCERAGYYSDTNDSLDFSAYIVDGVSLGVVCYNGEFGTYPGMLMSDNNSELLGRESGFDDAKSLVEQYLNEQY